MNDLAIDAPEIGWRSRETDDIADRPFQQRPSYRLRRETVELGA